MKKVPLADRKTGRHVSVQSEARCKGCGMSRVYNMLTGMLDLPELSPQTFPTTVPGPTPRKRRMSRLAARPVLFSPRPVLVHPVPFLKLVSKRNRSPPADSPGSSIRQPLHIFPCVSTICTCVVWQSPLPRPRLLPGRASFPRASGKYRIPFSSERNPQTTS